jgi:hypothetical protein
MIPKNRGADNDLVDIIVELAYSILSDYRLSVRRTSGNTVIRPHEVRCLLSNKIRVRKPVIQLILNAMQQCGMIKQNNQFIIFKAI